MNSKKSSKQRARSARSARTAVERIHAHEHDDAFKLMMDRFDRVDKDNKEIQDGLTMHIKDDNEVHKVVDKHSTYWGLLIGLGLPLVVGAIAWFQGLFK